MFYISYVVCVIYPQRENSSTVEKTQKKIDMRGLREKLKISPL